MAKGFGGLPGNMQGILQQAQKMQRDVQKAQELVDSYEAEGSAGGGAVVFRMNGKHEVLSVAIKPEAVDPSDVEMLQDLVKAAANDALIKIRDFTQEHLSKITGGMPLPGLF
jgi:DNA-binding YbaB/EbfC family protein